MRSFCRAMHAGWRRSARMGGFASPGLGRSISSLSRFPQLHARPMNFDAIVHCPVVADGRQRLYCVEELQMLLASTFVNRKGDSIGIIPGWSCRRKRGGSGLPAPPIVAKRARTAAKLWVFGLPGSPNAIGEPAIHVPESASSTRSFETAAFAIETPTATGQAPFLLVLYADAMGVTVKKID